MLTISEQLMHTTVRLECTSKDGSVSTGTGFFFKFHLNSEERSTVIVTNKHVIEGAQTGSFVLTFKDGNEQPILGAINTIQKGNFESRWIKHPDPNVDLAIFPIDRLIYKEGLIGNNYYYHSYDEGNLPTGEMLETIAGIEDIPMIGYPNGLWDSRNNMPIVRKGTTATNPKHDYQGLSRFVIDCACFPGSSGSPVLIFNQGSYTDARGAIHIGANRLILMGILFAGPQHAVHGEIHTSNPPMKLVPFSKTHIPNNLGYVIKSSKLLDFKPTIVSGANFFINA